MSRITIESIMSTISFTCGIIGILSIDGYMVFNHNIVPTLILLSISVITGHIALRESGYIRRKKSPNRRQAKLRESNKQHNNSTYVKYFQ